MPSRRRNRRTPLPADAAPATAALQDAIERHGPTFQRLEWLGDSILDALTTTALVQGEPDDGPESLVWLHEQRIGLVSDSSLAGAGDQMGLSGRGEDMADTVEALIGAGFVEGGWARATAVAAATVLDDVGGDRRGVRAGLGEADHRSRLAWVGEAVIEAAAAIRLFDAHADHAEGALTRARTRLASSDRLEAQAAARWPDLDLGSIRFIRSEIGARAVADGVVPAVAMADELLG